MSTVVPDGEEVQISSNQQWPRHRSKKSIERFENGEVLFDDVTKEDFYLKPEPRESLTSSGFKRYRSRMILKSK